jgi:hypothetical protein
MEDGYKPLTSVMGYLTVDDLTVDAIEANPAIDASAIVANEKAAPINNFDQMQVDMPFDADRYNVSNAQIIGIAWRQRDLIAIIDLAAHGVAPGFYLGYLAFAEGFNGERCPVHQSFLLQRHCHKNLPIFPSSEMKP